MNDLPKSVRERMARERAQSAHPDADLLNAFSENSLTASERKRVLEHVAICPECREIVFLAAPPSESAQTVLAPAKSRRFVWIAWASVAAVVVIVTSAVVVQRRNLKQVNEPFKSVTTAEVRPPAVDNEMKYAQVPMVSPKVSADKKSPASSEKTAAKPAQIPAPAQQVKEADSTLLADRRESAPPAVMPPLILEAKSRGAVTGGLAAEAAPPPPSSGPRTYGEAIVSNRVVAAPVASAKQEIMKDSRVDTTRAFSAVSADTQLAPRPHWRLSQSGTLERSWGGDTPWQWKPILPDKKFRVVSVIGSTVWAGGEGGALYVSRNGGESWTQVSLDTSATVTSIHFQDESTGTVETTAGMWSTSDGGKTWKKQ